MKSVCTKCFAMSVELLNIFGIDLQEGAKGNLPLIFNDIVPRLSEQNFPDLINELRTFSTKSNVIKCRNALTRNSLFTSSSSLLRYSGRRTRNDTIPGFNDNRNFLLQYHCDYAPILISTDVGWLEQCSEPVLVHFARLQCVVRHQQLAEHDMEEINRVCSHIYVRSEL